MLFWFARPEVALGAVLIAPTTGGGPKGMLRAGEVRSRSQPACRLPLGPSFGCFGPGQLVDCQQINCKNLIIAIITFPPDCGHNHTRFQEQPSSWRPKDFPSHISILLPYSRRSAQLEKVNKVTTPLYQATSGELVTCITLNIQEQSQFKSRLGMRLIYTR